MQRTLCFEYVGERLAVKGDWFHGGLGGLIEWTYADSTQKKHHVYRKLPDDLRSRGELVLETERVALLLQTLEARMSKTLVVNGDDELDFRAMVATRDRLEGRLDALRWMRRDG